MAHDDLIAQAPLPEEYKEMAKTGLVLLATLEPHDTLEFILEAERGDLERIALAAVALRAEVVRLRGERDGLKDQVEGLLSDRSGWLKMQNDARVNELRTERHAAERERDAAYQKGFSAGRLSKWGEPKGPADAS